jgi:hypothetical protein
LSELSFKVGHRFALKENQKHKEFIGDMIVPITATQTPRQTRASLWVGRFSPKTDAPPELGANQEPHSATKTSCPRRREASVLFEPVTPIDEIVHSIGTHHEVIRRNSFHPSYISPQFTFSAPTKKSIGFSEKLN